MAYNGYAIDADNYLDADAVTKRLDALIRKPVYSIMPDALQDYIDHYFNEKCAKSKEMTDTAKGVIPGGVEHNLAFNYPFPIAIAKAEGNKIAFISPGNYGLDFMKENYGMDLDRSVKCSNYIGLTVDMIKELGFEGMLLTGHAGKLVKVAGGIMNTHSREADCRMEIIASAAAKEGAGTELILYILDCLTTEEAFAKLREADSAMAERTATRLMDGILASLNRRAGGGIHIECIMYTKENGLIAASDGAEAMIRDNREQWNG